jgi:hypothetical protein
MVHLHAISVLLGSISLCSLTVVAIHAEPAAQNPAKGADVPSYTGQIGDWWVSAPGRVQFQILGSGKGVKDSKQVDLWFETPADKDLNTLFENLVLDVVVHAATKNLPVTVEAKNSSGDDGSVAAKAFDIVRVGFAHAQ